MNVCHVTMFYLPVTGGQETYIAYLNKILEQAGIETFVVQPLKRAAREKKVCMLPIIPKINFFIKEGAWFVFNVMLRLFSKKLKKHDVVICHYPFHYPAVNGIKLLLLFHMALIGLNLPLQKLTSTVCRLRCNVQMRNLSSLQMILIS